MMLLAALILALLFLTLLLFTLLIAAIENIRDVNLVALGSTGVILTGAVGVSLAIVCIATFAQSLA